MSCPLGTLREITALADVNEKQKALSVLILGFSSEENNFLQAQAPTEFSLNDADFKSDSAELVNALRDGATPPLAGIILKWDGVGGSAFKFVDKFRSALGNRLIPIIASKAEFLSSPERLLGEELGIRVVAKFLGEIDNTLLMFRELSERNANVKIQEKLERQFNAELKLGNHDKARKIIDSLLFVDEQNQLYMLMLGQVYERKGDIKTAEALYQKILVARPNYVKAMAALFNVFTMQDKNDAAQDIALRAEGIAADFLEEQLSLGRIALDQAEELQESAHLISAIGTIKNAEKFYQNRATQLLRAGKKIESISYLKGIVKKSRSKHIRGALNLKIGEIFKEIGKPDEARVHLDEAIRHSGLELPGAKALLKSLDNPMLPVSPKAVLEAHVLHIIPGPRGDPSVSPDLNFTPPKVLSPAKVDTVTAEAPPGIGAEGIAESSGKLEFLGVFAQGSAKRERRADQNRHLPILPPIDNIAPRAVISAINRRRDDFAEDCYFNRAADPIRNGRFMVFGRDQKRLHNLRSILTRKKAKSILATTIPMDAIKSVLTHRLDALLIEYDIGFGASLAVMEAISAWQDVIRVPILVLVPTQQALDDFVVKKGKILADSTTIAPKNDEQIVEAMTGLFSGNLNCESLGAFVGLVRKRVIDFRTGRNYQSLDSTVIDGLMTKIQGCEDGDFWSKFELLPVLEGRGNWVQYDQVLSDLDALDPAPTYSRCLFRAALTKAQGKVEQAGDDLFQQVTALKEHNELGLARVGSAMLNSKRADALGNLLKFWLKNGQLVTTTGQFHFLAAGHSFLLGDEKGGSSFLFKAVILEPTLFDHVSSLASYLATKGEFPASRDLLELAALLPNSDCRITELGIIKALINLKQKDVAGQRLDQLMKDHGEFLKDLNTSKRTA
jgi:tetratricopeptide (TPR) repeat protein